MKLKSKKYFQYKGPVYDLEIKSEQNDHSYNIENIVVHNSAAGSVVAYAIGITDCCPITHKLLFERFINPNRKVMADIDWDSEMGGREQVLDYLVSTYGQDQVCNVATFGTYGPKSALQDMSRGLDKPTGFDTVLMKKITKLPGLEESKNLEEFFYGEQDANGKLLKKGIKHMTIDSDIQDWISDNHDTIVFSNKLIGQMKNLGTHAGGIVVTPEPIYNLIPVTRGSGNIVTAFKEADGSSKDLSKLGILKLDVLGLKTLNVLKECVHKVKQDKGIDLSEKIYYLPLDDEKIINYFSTGNNYGIFQMDRSKMFTSQFDRDGAPVDSFEDIVAINAMNRPGPLEKFLPKYGYWKAIDQGKIKVTDAEKAEIDNERYPFEFMRKALEPTYGALLYQEQFMQMISDVTGMTFGDADSFRRAIAWRPDNPKYHTVKSYFDTLEESMLTKGYTKEDVEKFVQYCRDFMGYSFNRSHSCLTGDTTVDTPIGKKKLIDLQVGDEVLSYDENKKENVFTKVTHFFDQGVKEVIEIETESGKVIRATEDHLFMCEDGIYRQLKECIVKGFKIVTK